MPRPSDHALRQVGQPITWERFEPNPKRVEGTCVAVEPSFSTITTERGCFPGVRFKIKPTGGGRAVWTCAFADEGHEPS